MEMTHDYNENVNEDFEQYQVMPSQLKQTRILCSHLRTPEENLEYDLTMQYSKSGYTNDVRTVFHEKRQADVRYNWTFEQRIQNTKRK